MHRDSIDRFEVHTIPSLAGRKRLGSYLLEAGLINEAQVEVALNDQQATGMKFGEVLATRGWVKQQTIEYLMKKVVAPERKARAHKTHSQAHKTHSQDHKTYSQTDGVNGKSSASKTTQRRSPSGQPAASSSRRAESPPARSQQTSRRAPVGASGRSPAKQPAPSYDSSLNRRDAPISKPLPSVSNPNDDVSWVG
ncbi:MAG: hypothetical protein AAGA75_02555 [Cyanobacteria bacterium P01_E01_bin.6]